MLFVDSAALETLSNPHPTSEGTSLSMPAIVAIIVGVALLFGGLAWFMWHVLAVLPGRKKELVGERRRRRQGRV